MFLAMKMSRSAWRGSAVRFYDVKNRAPNETQANSCVWRPRNLTERAELDGTCEVVNQIAYKYNGWGNLAVESQAHDGDVDEETTPGVQYHYDDGVVAGVAKYVRLDHLTYPDGNREIDCN
jgi:hypothetical protein